MKNTTKLLALLLTVIMAVSLLVSCGGGQGTGKMTLVIVGDETTEYTVTLDEVEGNTVAAVLEYLKETKGMAFEYSGTMVNKVGELENDAAKGNWIYFWTSVAADADVTEWASYVEYGGKTLTSSGKNVFEMSAYDGAIIYIGYYR